MYCGKCCKKNSGRETCCRHCGNPLCTNLGPDAGTRHKTPLPEIEESQRPVLEFEPEPESEPESKPERKKRRMAESTYVPKRQFIYRPIDNLQKIIKREPVELGPKDYVMLGVPLVLVIVQLYAIYALGPVLLKRMNLDQAAFTLMNMDQAFFKQSDKEAQIVGLWALDFEASPDLEPFKTDSTENQIMFTEDRMMRIIISDKENGETIVRIFEGRYVLRNTTLSADLSSPDEASDIHRISSLIEIDGDTLQIIWVSGFPFDPDHHQVESSYRRIDSNQSLFDE